MTHVYFAWARDICHTTCLHQKITETLYVKSFLMREIIFYASLKSSSKVGGYACHLIFRNLENNFIISSFERFFVLNIFHLFFFQLFYTFKLCWVKCQHVKLGSPPIPGELITDASRTPDFKNQKSNTNPGYWSNNDLESKFNNNSMMISNSITKSN